MGRKKLILIIAAVFLITLSAGIYFYPKSNLDNIQKNVSLQNSPSEKLNEYLDGSGFKFKYPDNVKVESKETDSATYTNLQISQSALSGGISLKVTDSNLKSIEEAVSGSTKEITLAKLSGKETSISNGIKAGVLDKGILFEINVDFGESKDFWQKVYDDILSTFEFSSNTNPQNISSQTAGEDEVIFEGEEVVE